MSIYRTFRMWRQPVWVVGNGNCTIETWQEWKPTRLTFKGRTQAEAQRKADQFWREAQFGIGSMVVLPEGEAPASR